MSPNIAIAALWIGWAISWFAAALWSGRTEKRLGTQSELTYRLVAFIVVVVLIIAVRIVYPRAHGYFGALRLWHVTLAEGWACIALIACGLAFCWWARIHLGTLWSASITKKAGHHIVDTGPYRIVRHPIYTGLLLAVYATAGVSGTTIGIIVAAAVTLGLWLKARLEEGWLSRELDSGAYEAYRRRVPMLVPFGPKSHRPK